MTDRPTDQMVAADIPFDDLSGVRLDDPAKVVAAVCEQAGVFRLHADSGSDDLIAALETLDRAMTTAKFTHPRREAVRAQVRKHCRDVGIKDVFRLIDAVLTPKKRASSTGPQASAFTLADDEPAAAPVDGPQVLADTAASYLRYVVMSPAQADLCALWVGAAFAIDAFDQMPMLMFSSATHECGKTTASTVTSAITPRPFFVSSLTPAVLFRLIDAYHPTLIADEVDSWLTDEKSELRGVFNCAHWRSAAVIARCVGDDHQIQLFNVFGAKVIAMIGKPAPAMLSRCIVIQMQPKTKADRVEHFLVERLRDEHLDLRRRWRRWAIDHRDALRGHQPAMDGLPQNRIADNLAPLIAIADLCGGAWPSRARDAAGELLGARPIDDADVNVRLLADVRQVFCDRDARPRPIDPNDPDGYISTADLVAALKVLPERPWADWNHGRGITDAQLARRLKPFRAGPDGLHARVVRVGDKTPRRWVRDDFIDAWARYLTDGGPDRASDPQHPQHANDSGPKPQICDPQHSPNVAGPENAISSMNPGSVAGVAGSDPDLEPLDMFLLSSGESVPWPAARLALELADRGFSMGLDGRGRFTIADTTKLTEADRVAIDRWRSELAIIVAVDADANPGTGQDSVPDLSPSSMLYSASEPFNPKGAFGPPRGKP